MSKGKFSPLDLRQINDREFKLLADLVFVDDDGTETVVPSGFVTDLASVPSQFWGLFPPADRYSEAAVVHDWEIAQAGSDKKLRILADKKFLRMMAILNVHALRRYPMFWAVWFWSVQLDTPIEKVLRLIQRFWAIFPRWIQILVKYVSFLGITGWFLRDWGPVGKVIDFFVF